MVISWVYEVLYVVRFDWEYIYLYIYLYLYYTERRRRTKRSSIYNAMYAMPLHVPSMYLSCEREKKSHDSDQPHAYIT